jgi:preprotein translocase subunit SecB
MMAEDEGGAIAGMPGDGEDGAPQAGLLTQYVKDLSFENPNAPAVYQWQSQPRIDVQFNIASQTVGDELYEVSLKVEVKADSDEGVTFQVELLYAGLFAIRNVSEDQLHPFLFAEAPRLLFPFARRVIADVIRDGGFPPLLLDPIDFGAMYVAQTQASDENSGIIGHA